MKIGIDLSVLQSDHRFRGIGSVVINFINNLDEKDKARFKFVFFIEKEDENIAYEQLNLDGVSFEVRYLVPMQVPSLPGKLALAYKIFSKIKGYIEYHTGDSRIPRSLLKDIDSFIQFDQNRKLPYGAPKFATLFIYDLIPYILESDYLWSYATARRNEKSIKESLKMEIKRLQYASRLKINMKRAHSIISISSKTKEDFVHFLGANPKKISVIHLGINPLLDDKKSNKKPDFYDFKTTMWGTVRKPFDPKTKPYLLFIGGIDHRRKIVELLSAYNNLRARGIEISLIMSGDTLKGINDIKTPIIKKYLEQNTSYMDDIHLIGFANNTQRDWLYKNALAFVFPSVYEGFGLPVLEAMAQGTPVIAFKSDSVHEIAGSKILYAHDGLTIASDVLRLINTPKLADSLSSKSINHAKSFTWEKAKDKMLAHLQNQK